MSLITRCPACGTMFKVVPDQLRISEGWVRCGHCSEVFDASAHMQGDSPAPVSIPVPVTAPMPMPASDPVPAAASWPGPQMQAERPEDLLHHLPAAVPLAEPDAFMEPEFLVQPLMAQQESPPPAYQDELQAVDWAAEEDAQQTDAALQDVSFVRQARRKAFWRRPLVRALLGLTGLALLAALALQAAIQDRDRLAAAQPQLRPWLQALCEPLQCKVGPPRQIEAIVIDSSSFSKLRGDAYRLAFTLKNQTGAAIAMPAIELTLTDGQDQPLVRRVLTPADLGVVSGLLEADWSGSLSMSVASSAGAGRVAGYRVLAFYP